MRPVIRFFIGSLLLFSTLPLAAQQSGYCGFGQMMWGGGGWLMGPFFAFLLFASIVALVAFTATKFSARGTPSTKSPHGTEAAIEILRTRFAKGEIDQDEYQQRKQLLE